MDSRVKHFIDLFNRYVAYNKEGYIPEKEHLFKMYTLARRHGYNWGIPPHLKNEYREWRLNRKKKGA